MTKLFHTTQSDLTKYNGTAVTVLHELDESEYDKADVGQMYKIKFFDGHTADAFEDELLPYDPYYDDDIVCLCGSVFYLAYELGYAVGKRGADSLEADSRDLARITINEAIQFENQFDEDEGDYMLEVGELSADLINYIYDIFGKEDTNP